LARHTMQLEGLLDVDHGSDFTSAHLEQVLGCR
jgi:hypothetical protein